MKIKIGNWRPVLIGASLGLILSGLWMAAMPYTTSGGVNTYRTSFSVSCGGAGVCASIYGASGSAIRVREVWVAQASSTVNASLVEYSTAATGGTATSKVPTGGVDMAVGAPTAAVKAYTAAPTAGTSYATVAGPLSVTSSTAMVVAFGANNDQPVTLTSAAQGLGVVVDGATTVTITIEWTE